MSHKWSPVRTFKCFQTTKKTFSTFCLKHFITEFMIDGISQYWDVEIAMECRGIWNRFDGFDCDTLWILLYYNLWGKIGREICK